MMDVFSVAASVISVVSLLIQLAEKVQLLHDFWSSVRNAPLVIQDISYDLQLFCNILHSIAQSSIENDPLLHKILRRCDEKVDRLKEEIEQLEPGYASKKLLVRKWSSFKAKLKQNIIADFQSSLKDTKIDLLLARSMEQKHTRSERNAVCLLSLSPTDQKPMLMRIIRNQKSTCQWFFHSAEFNSWNSHSGNHLLRIDAGPGCGKTTIAAHIVQRLTDELDEKPTSPTQSTRSEEANPPRHILLSFFFQRANVEADSAISALKTLVHQFTVLVPSLMPLLLEQYDYISTKGVDSWSWEYLRAVFIKMLRQIRHNERVSIIFDAVDECNAESRGDLMEYISEIIDDPTEASCSPKPSVKVLITSRPNQQISDVLWLSSVLEIKNADTAGDVNTLIQRSVRKFAVRRKLNATVESKIKHFLKANAQGVFLWAVLIMQELEKRDLKLTDETITEKLSSVPTTLADTYETILNDAEICRRQDMWRVLRWLMYGKRVLKMDELQSILCFETGDEQWYDFEQDIKHLCGSLVKIEDGEIGLIHQTARDFLQRFARERAGETSGPKIDFQQADLYIAKTCLGFMLHEDTVVFDIRSGKAYQEEMDSFLQSRPFLAYAAEYWASHFEPTSVPAADLSAMVVRLLSTQRLRNTMMQLTYYIKHHGTPFVPYNASALHLAAYFNLPWLLDRYISKGANPNFISGVCGTPLTWASETGSSLCVEKLLRAGANPNQAEPDGWTPLHWAARNGHTRVVEILLQNGACTDAVHDGGATPMDWALHRKHTSVADVIRRHEGVLSRTASDLLELEPWSDCVQRRSSCVKYNRKCDTYAMLVES